jgi:hypothetical protein
MRGLVVPYRLVGFVGGVQRLFGVHFDQGVHRGIHRTDAVQLSPDELGRAGHAVPDQLGGRGRRPEQELAHRSSVVRFGAGRPEQPDGVVVAQHPGRHLPEPGEVSDGEHDTSGLRPDTVSGSSALITRIRVTFDPRRRLAF